MNDDPRENGSTGRLTRAATKAVAPVAVDCSGWDADMMTTHGKTHKFTLILSGVNELTDEVCDALFEAGCDDALPGTRDGVVFLDFSREGKSIQEAVLAAIGAVERAGVGACVVRLEPEELMAMPECAERIRK
jgi:hypothetical protein